MHRATTPKSVKDFLAALAKSDVTIAEWAREREFPLSTVYLVTQGRLVGRRGVSRKIVRAMGLPVPPMHGRSVAHS